MIDSLRVCSLVSVLMLQGCVGFLVEYKSEEKISNVRYGDHSESFNSKDLEGLCDLVETYKNREIFECRDGEEWGFISIALGISVPIPYFHYDLRSTYVLDNGVVKEIRHEETKMFGMVCGIIGGHDVFVPGCYINDNKYY